MTRDASPAPAPSSSGALRRGHLAPVRVPVRSPGHPAHRLPGPRRPAPPPGPRASTLSSSSVWSTSGTWTCSPVEIEAVAATAGARPSRPSPARARSRSCWAATTPSPCPTSPGWPAHVGWGRVSVIHFDAHADTGDTQFGSLYGHGTPMRRLIESGAARGDRFLQIGLRGYWPEPETLAWMAEQGMRSFEMTEIEARGLEAVPDRGLRPRHRRVRRRLLVGRHRRRRPRARPRARARPSPAASARRQLLDAVRRATMELPVAGIDVVEVSPPTTTPRSPPTWPTAWSSRPCRDGLAPAPAAGATARRAEDPLLEGRRPPG